MEKWLLMCGFVLGLVSIAFADPMAVCTNLTGTYAEAEHAEKPLLSVAFTNGQFLVSDPTGKKNIVSATPTERGLVFVEDAKDRNTFRLSRISGTDEYVVERLGKEGKPAAAGGGAQRLIRLGALGVKKDTRAEAEKPRKTVKSIPDARWLPGEKTLSRLTADGHVMWTMKIPEDMAGLEENDGTWVFTTVTGKRYGIDIATGRMLWIK
jgi:hypothetical protein